MQWLGEWGMFRIWNWLGLDGLLMSPLHFGLTYANIASELLGPGVTGSSPRVSFSLSAASSHHFLVRPHLVSIALMAWTTRWRCDLIPANEAGSFHPPLLFAVFVFWTNVHAGALGGVVQS